MKFNEYEFKIAASVGLTEIIKKYIKNGGDVNIDNCSALVEAAANNRLDIVKILIDNGADINKCKTNPLEMATLYGHFEVAKYLVDVGIKPNHKTFINTARRGNLNFLKYLEKKGANINPSSDAILITASMQGHVNIIKHIIKYDLSKDGILNALKWASIREELNVIKYLSDVVVLDSFYHITKKDTIVYIKDLDILIKNGVEYTVSDYLPDRKDCLLFNSLDYYFKKIFKKFPHIREFITNNKNEFLIYLIKHNHIDIFEYLLKERMPISNTLLLDLILINNEEFNLLLKKYGYIKRVESDLEEIVHLDKKLLYLVS